MRKSGFVLHTVNSYVLQRSLTEPLPHSRATRQILGGCAPALSGSQN